MNQRYENPSEYGGGDGSNYITPSGRPRELSAGERAALLRREGVRPGNPATDPGPGSIQLTPGFRQD